MINEFVAKLPGYASDEIVDPTARNILDVPALKAHQMVVVSCLAQAITHPATFNRDPADDTLVLKASKRSIHCRAPYSRHGQTQFFRGEKP